jgi:glycine dehydrogenase subunit 1
MGPRGLRETAELCLRKSRYLLSLLTAHPRFELAFNAPTLKEFVIRDRKGQVESLLESALSDGYLAGLPLGRWYPELCDCLLISTTEKRTRAEIEGLANSLKS